MSKDRELFDEAARLAKEFDEAVGRTEAEAGNARRLEMIERESATETGFRLSGAHKLFLVEAKTLHRDHLRGMERFGRAVQAAVRGAGR